jgi:hypothetical protein
VSGGRLVLAAALIVLPVATAQDSVEGRWAMHVAWPNRPAEVTLTVSNAQGELVVLWEGLQGVLEGHEAAYADGVLSFSLRVEEQGDRAIELRFEGHVDGDHMEGKLVLPRGREIPARGERLPGREVSTADRLSPATSSIPAR